MALVLGVATDILFVRTLGFGPRHVSHVLQNVLTLTYSRARFIRNSHFTMGALPLRYIPIFVVLDGFEPPTSPRWERSLPLSYKTSTQVYSRIIN